MLLLFGVLWLLHCLGCQNLRLKNIVADFGYPVNKVFPIASVSPPNSSDYTKNRYFSKKYDVRRKPAHYVYIFAPEITDKGSQRPTEVRSTRAAMPKERYFVHANKKGTRQIIISTQS